MVVEVTAVAAVVEGVAEVVEVVDMVMTGAVVAVEEAVVV